MSTRTPTQPRKLPRQSRSMAMVDTILEASARVLKARGYEGMTTNAVAECAGISVGSLYQYFPNKASLLAALHARHAKQMADAIELVLAKPRDDGLAGAVQGLIRAAMAAHEVEPELHRLLEKERPLLEENMGAAGERIHRHVAQLLDRHRAQIGHEDLELAAWLTMKMTESLVHAAVLESVHGRNAAKVEAAIVNGVLGFLRCNR
ncbi:TetR/AcrR family transcriptional regulator [Variovorax sp. J22P271]|uniref:TetR/AcrR family transcriptional regulator n=1 Tax=Variovorax davisae TaxID=3053515 RepID=UPI002577C3C5|nr:TetR/AcrR family transcriptional regulator [Variovorax sp. J22P271]MDM0033455.1 TetR/AcrR family transcriptional regulator [Variovorax sp. J22P271]